MVAAVRNCGEGLSFGAIRMGRPSLVTDLVIGADLGLPVEAPLNGATLLRRPDPGEVPTLLADLRDLFAGPGGDWQVIDPWSELALEAEGFSQGIEPCMLRRAGGSAPPQPGGLSVVEVTDEVTVAHMNAVVTASYGLPPHCSGHLHTIEAFGDPRYRAWVGYLRDHPVSTAAACIAGGLVGVYIVGTVPEARGKGYGEALTWAAVTSAPELDATLQASEMGGPIYEQMGFRTIATWNVWTTQARGR
jgi:GNAT superfamily N-acetyltransferase